MPGHSFFIQMSKLPNVKGEYRILQAMQGRKISMPPTAPPTAPFTDNLEESQQEFQPTAQRQMYRSKELIIARNLYAIRAITSTHGLYRGVP